MNINIEKDDEKKPGSYLDIKTVRQILNKFLFEKKCQKQS
jgi:hypothetical protein